MAGVIRRGAGRERRIVVAVMRMVVTLRVLVWAGGATRMIVVAAAGHVGCLLGDMRPVHTL
ncbi:hypothetical protein YWS52_26260 [Chitiniphilus shinanonensis]